VHQFEILLQALSVIEGKFLLSSYPSSVLDQYTTQFNWQQKLFDHVVSVAVKEGNPKTKTKVLTANYPLEVNQNQLLLF
jgi:DNA adenine methylase